VRGRNFAKRSSDLRGLLSAARDVRKIIRREQADIVHTTLYASDIVGRIAALGTRAQVLSSLVGNTYVGERLTDPNVSAGRLNAARVLDAWTARASRCHFHCLSEMIKTSAQPALKIPDERITVIPRGRDPVRLGRPDGARRASVRQALGLDSDAEVAVNVGRQEFRKDQLSFLEAIAELAGKRPRLIGLQVGPRGHATDQLEERVDVDDLRGRVHLLGQRDDVPDILAAADVFVFPSLYEGLGGSVIEAMGLGLPIVASDTPALRELVEPEENALLVPIRSPQKLAAAIERTLDDEDLSRRFGARSRQIFEERFTLERSADLMLKLYDRVAARS
jgi:glycosyltransferase involved in cell wall biosynthesis